MDASVGCTVPAATAEMRAGDPLRLWVEPYAELPVNLERIRGPVPQIVSIKPFSPFRFYIERKLYMHNMSHAMLAYLGRLAGVETIWQAVRNERLASQARGALHESAEALSRKHGVPLEELEAFANDLMRRYDNQLLGDTVERVGHDPVRKLKSTDRLVGAAFNCLESEVEPEQICAGIAAALLFRAEDDPASLEIQKSIKENGLEKTLERYCGINSANSLYPLISRHYSDLRP